ncbi:hypothetical protein EHS13_11715 [Paenibacillus psychroresistens]|uniref:Uncharacterized protein n=1 Tax=Paenibacillus psychroresistens TaxID=1778678 RepID=A0A6B8RJI9_9BACL|nr:hypothetical protein [Paenibacillus psychroresistens]QGQ95498.1 hypothetical protein EHS13_11715 [Paenibacillus psychroresistens]
MPLALQDFTSPTNTLVIADTAAGPGTLPTPAVFVAPTTPFIDGVNAYIWSPNNASGQIVTLRTDFFVVGLPILAVILPVSVFYAYAGNETITVTATLDVINILGIIVLSIPLFVDNNLGNPDNVAIASADALLGVGILTGNTVRIRVDAVGVAPVTLPYAPPNTGRYLGEITVRTVI